MGGFINQYASWRWSYYVLIIWSGVMLICMIFLVPETYMPVVLRNKARKLRKDTGDDRWKAQIEVHEKSVAMTVLRSLPRPFMLLFMDPMCFNLCLFTSIVLGILYLFFGAFHLVFREVYNFELYQIGLSFVGLLTGMLIGIFSDPIWQWNYRRLLRNYEAKTGEPKSEPEFRLPPTISESILYLETASMSTFTDQIPSRLMVLRQRTIHVRVDHLLQRSLDCA